MFNQVESKTTMEGEKEEIPFCRGFPVSSGDWGKNGIFLTAHFRAVILYPKFCIRVLRTVGSTPRIKGGSE